MKDMTNAQIDDSNRELNSNSIDKIADEEATLEHQNYANSLSFEEVKELIKIGIVASQKWLPIQRDSDGFLNLATFDGMRNNFPILIKYDDGNIEMFYDISFFV